MFSSMPHWETDCFKKGRESNATLCANLDKLGFQLYWAFRVEELCRLFHHLRLPDKSVKNSKNYLYQVGAAIQFDQAVLFPHSCRKHGLLSARLRWKCPSSSAFHRSSSFNEFQEFFSQEFGQESAPQLIKALHRQPIIKPHLCKISSGQTKWLDHVNSIYQKLGFRKNYFSVLFWFYFGSRIRCLDSRPYERTAGRRWPLFGEPELLAQKSQVVSYHFTNSRRNWRE